MRFPSATTTRPAELRAGAATRALGALVALTLLACVVAIAGREPLRGGGSTPARPSSYSARVDGVPPPRFPVPGALPPEVFVVGEDEGPLVPTWLAWALAGIGLTGVLGAGVVLARALPKPSGRRRTRRDSAPALPPAETPPSSPSPEDEAEIACRALAAASARLQDQADPRAAVIAAYERLEQVLAEKHLGRRSPEAPREYLARVLSERRMPEHALATLTFLFEEARFSSHPISESAPRRAFDALESARVALAAGDPQPGAQPSASRARRGSAATTRS
jgi:Domain of unknown function (DUF4129)